MLTRIFSWLNRHAFSGIDASQAFLGALIALGFFAILYVIAHFVDKRKKR